MPTELTESQKLEALAVRFYNGIEWHPKAGDFYTSSRPDLELYRVAKIVDGKIYTEYCTSPGQLAEWDLEGFTTEGFGDCRVHVPDYVFGPQQMTDDNYDPPYDGEDDDCECCGRDPAICNCPDHF